jgi:hypothetical protein
MHALEFVAGQWIAVDADFSDHASTDVRLSHAVVDADGHVAYDRACQVINGPAIHVVRVIDPLVKARAHDDVESRGLRDAPER